MPDSAARYPPSPQPSSSNSALVAAFDAHCAFYGKSKSYSIVPFFPDRPAGVLDTMGAVPADDVDGAGGTRSRFLR